MGQYLTTDQVSRVSGAPVSTLNMYSQAVLRPARPGNRRTGHQWSQTQALAVSVGQIVRRMGISGPPLYGVMQEIARHGTGDLDRVLEGRDVLAVVPGVGAVARLMSREEYESLSAATWEQHGIAAIGIDVGRMWTRLQECLAEHERAGWQALAEATE